MDNNKLNLAELLRGCEGTKIYSLVEGENSVQTINEWGIKLYGGYFYMPDGLFLHAQDSSASCLLYPTREAYEKHPLDPAKAWEEWRGQCALPKTWSELVEFAPKTLSKEQVADINSLDGIGKRSICADTDATASLALRKILLLVRHGYGGNVGHEGFVDDYMCPAAIYYSHFEEEFIIDEQTYNQWAPITFRDYDAAEEFLSHPSNIRLLKDFFCVK